MEINLFKSVDRLEFLRFSSDQLSGFFENQRSFVDELEKENAYLKFCNKELEEKVVLIGNQLVKLKNKLYGRSSERRPKKDPKERRRSGSSRDRKSKKKVQLPSERYPDAPLIEREVELQELPDCSCCGTKMADSGMTEDSEFLTVIPAQYIVILQKRHKYRCTKCHGEIKTAPAPDRITPGSTYSDEMMIDVAMSKFCDLIPIERYSKIAGREGLEELPPHSLIGATHNLADFVEPAYNKIREEVSSSIVLHADETPHKMLEGDEKKSWYLWGFSTQESGYFDIRDTRSGDVASELLKEARCEYLVSDVFTGYKKAVRESNKYRAECQRAEIKHVYCNAHSRRYFNDAAEKFSDESSYFLDRYRKIYALERQGKNSPFQLQEYRQRMRPIFDEMKRHGEEIKDGYSSKSLLVRAINYFLTNYEGLTLFLENPDVPIDNNHQERQLRNPVIGRKTWYGTHSRRGAHTSAVLFSLVESCKLNGINPRRYFKSLVDSLHKKMEAFTPKDYKLKPTDTG